MSAATNLSYNFFGRNFDSDVFSNMAITARINIWKTDPAAGLVKS